MMWKRIAVPLLTLACSTVAHACLPPLKTTAYFGTVQPMYGDLEDKIQAEIKENHYQVIEHRIGLEFFPIVRKGDAVYPDGKVIATKDDSFRSFGQGYYRVNHKPYYMGKQIGNAPANGSVRIYVEDRSKAKPADFPPNVMFCPVAAHADILETSDGLRVEHVVYDN